MEMWMADESNSKKVSDLVRLRQRFLDLQKLGALEPATFGMFQQSFMEVYQQAEQRRQSCMARAATLEAQAAAARSEAHAFSAISSILYSIVDGHIGLEQRRITEEQSRQAQEDGTAPKQSASGAVYDDDDTDAAPPVVESFEGPPAEKAKAKKKPGRPKGSKNKK